MTRFVLAVLVLALAAAPAQAACPQGARCGRITVPLDHSGLTPGTVPLAYAVLPATGTRTGTVVVLTGGPGQPGVSLARVIARALKPLRATQDIVVLDSRGTGGSDRVACDPDKLTDCAARLGARRAFWNTPESARDVEDLRAALGVDPITVLGVSYGTKVAAEYARRYPAHTAALVMDSPVAVEGIDAEAATGIASFPRVLRETCAASAACRASIPDPGAALTAAVARLQRGRVYGVFTRRDGKQGHGYATESGLYEALRASETLPTLRADLPAAIVSLAHGDAAAYGRAGGRFGSFDGGDDDVVRSRFYATTCIESALPWAPDSSVESRTAARDAFLDGPAKQLYAPFSPGAVYPGSAASDCADWPPTPRPEAAPPVPPGLRTLVLSGHFDLRTPLESAQQIAAQYPGAVLADFPGQAHSLISTSACASQLVARFLAGQPVGACPAPTPVLDTAGYLPATRRGLGMRAAVRLTVAAAIHSAREDVLLNGWHRATIGALRGGTLTRGRGRLTLRRASWIRGVHVSGSLNGKGNGRVVAGGRVYRVRRGRV